MDTVRIFVGCAANNEDLESQAVFEYSLRKHSSLPVAITWMQLSRNPNSPFYSDKDKGWQTKHWATPFSGFRWIVSELCEHKGKGIYFDSDFIVLGDIAELWLQPLREHKIVIAKGARAGTRYCCSLWEAERFAAFPHFKGEEWLRANEGAHASLCSTFAKHLEVVQEFEGGDWNLMDYSLPVPLAQPQVKAIHYTQIPTQLQLKHAIPRLKAAGQEHWFEGKVQAHPRQDFQKMFDDLLAEARENGYPIENYIREPYGCYSIRGRD